MTRSRRTKLLVALSIVIVFAGALVLWAGSSPDSDLPPAALGAASDGSGTGALTTQGPRPSGGATSGKASQVPTALAPLPGFGLPSGSGSLTSLGPGIHRVVITLESNVPLGQIGYVVRGAPRGTKASNVKSPVVITRYVSGADPRPYAVGALQVAADGTSGECTITIDGKSYVHEIANGPNRVAVCVA